MGKIKKEKTSKNSREKKSRGETSKKRKNGEKKKNSNDEGARKYGYISAKSIITMAEAAGFTGIQEDVAKNLAEDVTYRLRYIIQQCKKFMIHSRHKKLTSSDINEVFKMCDVPAIYGYNVDSPLHKFIYIKEADVYVLEDNVIDLPEFALSEITVQQEPSLFMSGSWLKPEENKFRADNKNRNEDARIGEPHTSNNFKNLHSVPLNHENKASIENAENESKIPTNLIKYYGITCNKILGHSDLKVVFQDLSTNNKILPIIPYLLNFITMTLNKLINERQIKRLLQSVEALSKNLGIDFTPYLATTRVINAMLLIVAVDKVNYDYHLRAYAARVLSVVLARWCTRDEQRAIVICKMGKILNNYKSSTKVHYGAMVLLISMGPEALTISFWANLKEYLMNLKQVQEDYEPVSPNQYEPVSPKECEPVSPKECEPRSPKECDSKSPECEPKSPEDISMLEDVVLLAAALLYRFPVKTEDIELNVQNLDAYLYSYFGDVLCCVRLSLLENPKYIVSLYKNNCSDLESESDLKSDLALGFEDKWKRSIRICDYISNQYRIGPPRITVDSVFTLPKTKKKTNSRISFKFAGAIPVPVLNLKRKRLDSNHLQFVGEKQSKTYIVIGNVRKIRRIRPLPSIQLPVGCIYSVL